MKTIGILSGMGPESTAQFYMEIIKECQKQSGAQALVLACTDLPIVVNQSDFKVPVFDTIEVLARVTVQYARGRSRMRCWSRF